MSHERAGVTGRVLPEPDRYATCPNEGRVLAYYAGVFESVYVLLHPFIKPVSIDPSVFKPDSYPDRETIVANCKAVSWAEVATLGHFSSLSEIDVGLRTQVGGLRSDIAKPEYAARLSHLCDATSIVTPDEGYFSDLTHDLMLGFIQELGYRWVWVGDEFCTERKLHWIDDLKSVDTGATRGHVNVFTPDKALLWTTHWDSCCAFVAGARASLERLDRHNWAEGFFCTERTEVYWGAHET